MASVMGLTAAVAGVIGIAIPVVNFVVNLAFRFVG